ncbi:hypothetical protein [Paenibacillus sp. Y412MC10]|uniref:hypothetical protein n=1 Tax=Geobacillus sp. (strain Y412MC10) TaxID=481743 RepID=UPI0016434715|nr:hypothetical protein [Paenibacillus sp. Y412MC10]
MAQRTNFSKYTLAMKESVPAMAGSFFVKGRKELPGMPEACPFCHGLLDMICSS